MSHDDLNAAFSFIEGRTEVADFDGAKPEYLILLAEDVLGIEFPPTYRLFIKKYGCGGIDGSEFFGLIGPNFESSGVPDVVWITLDLRRSSLLPDSLIPVYALGNGSYFAIDRSIKSTNSESPVVFWDAGSPPEDRREDVAEDFGQFMLMVLENRI